MALERSITGIFAHQDDESILCAGTFAKYVQEGADAYIVYVTDGRRGKIATRKNSTNNHDAGNTAFQDIITARREGIGTLPVSSNGKRPGDEKYDLEVPATAQRVQWLIEKRKEEANEAARRLGIPPDHVIFLGIPDCQIDRSSIEAIQRAMQETDTSVYVTHGMDGLYGHPDHIATTMAVYSARDNLVKQWTKTHPNGRPDTLPRFNMRKVAQAVVSDSDRLLVQYSKMNIPPRDLTVIDTRAYKEQVLFSARAYETQQNLVEIFTERGLIGRGKEEFYDHNNLVPTSAGSGDLFANIDHPPITPEILTLEPANRFSSNIPDFHNRVKGAYVTIYENAPLPVHNIL